MGKFLLGSGSKYVTFDLEYTVKYTDCIGYVTIYDFACASISVRHGGDTWGC